MVAPLADLTRIDGSNTDLSKSLLRSNSSSASSSWNPDAASSKGSREMYLSTVDGSLPWIGFSRPSLFKTAGLILASRPTKESAFPFHVPPGSFVSIPLLLRSFTPTPKSAFSCKYSSLLSVVVNMFPHVFRGCSMFKDVVILGLVAINRTQSCLHEFILSSEERTELGLPDFGVSACQLHTSSMSSSVKSFSPAKSLMSSSTLNEVNIETS